METRHDRFEQLFRANYAAVRAYALRRAPADVAQDVVAETFLAWRRLEAVPDDALPWLFGVARRVLANERLTLVAWHGLSGARAARAAGCSPATFAVRLHRARAKLAAQLALLEQAPEPLEVRS